MTRAQELLAGFVKDCPPCMVFYGPKDSGQLEMFDEYFKDKAAKSDILIFRKPKLDELLELHAWLQKLPENKYRVVRIEQGDEISKEASNFLLKIIEDSPDYVRWVVMTASRQILGPLASRSFMVPFRASAEQKEPDAIDFSKANGKLVEALKANGYHHIFAVCQSVKKELKEVEDESVEREVYTRFCDTVMEHYKGDYRKVHKIQETKNLMKRGIHCEQLFKVMVLKLIYG